MLRVYVHLWWEYCYVGVRVIPAYHVYRKTCFLWEFFRLIHRFREGFRVNFHSVLFFGFPLICDASQTIYPDFSISAYLFSSQEEASYLLLLSKIGVIEAWSEHIRRHYNFKDAGLLVPYLLTELLHLVIHFISYLYSNRNNHHLLYFFNMSLVNGALFLFGPLTTLKDFSLLYFYLFHITYAKKPTPTIVIL